MPTNSEENEVIKKCKSIEEKLKGYRQNIKLLEKRLQDEKQFLSFQKKTKKPPEKKFTVHSNIGHWIYLNFVS